LTSDLTTAGMNAADRGLFGGRLFEPDGRVNRIAVGLI
jgi:hypothetical protein